RSAQVLLFTCHHHIVDIVRAVAPEVPILELPTVDPEIRAVDAVTLKVDPEAPSAAAERASD
ncbi:MAG: hypothetical protein KC420_20870, partial [Myxococcales bacterium]|nr:hypothetical protein [Myxococcales bacterium]